MTTLPRDSDNTPIPALRLNPTGAHQINATNVSARNTTAFDSDTRVISVFATVPVRIQCGDNTVVATATSHFFPANIYYDFAIGGGKTLHSRHIAVLAHSTNGVVYISEKQ